MSKAARHTPGPWQESDVQLHDYRETIATSAGCFIADVYHKDSCNTDPEEQANVYLIAAAPDLLETLIIARDTINNMAKYGDSIAPAKIRSIIQQTINKAQGIGV